MPIRLHRCADWSAHLLFACKSQVFSHMTQKYFEITFLACTAQDYAIYVTLLLYGRHYITVFGMLTTSGLSFYINGVIPLLDMV